MGLTVSGKDRDQGLGSDELGASAASSVTGAARRDELDLEQPNGAAAADRKPEAAPAKDRLWVNHKRTKLVRMWADGTVEVAERATPGRTWGPPTYLTEEVYG